MKKVINCDHTLEETAKILDMTRKQVKQIEIQPLKKLKSPKVGKQLKDYIVGTIS